MSVQLLGIFNYDLSPEIKPRRQIKQRERSPHNPVSGSAASGLLFSNTLRGDMWGVSVANRPPLMSAHQQLPAKMADPPTTIYSTETIVNRLVCGRQHSDIKPHKSTPSFIFWGVNTHGKNKPPISQLRLIDFWVRCMGGRKKEEHTTVSKNCVNTFPSTEAEL